MINFKTSIAFPEIGRIRKGAPKARKVQGDREISTVGKDLNDRFRVVFAPGEDQAIEKFLRRYETLEPKEIVFIFPFARVDDVWDASYTAYNAGRMIAKADGEKFIYKVNPQTGELEVKDGQPVVPFRHGDKISYTRADGKPVVLPMRPTGMLRIFIPELERLVQLTLVTTSFYDCLHITQQLCAIQLLCAALNAGSVAGVPIILSRKPQQITWVKENGQATRIEKWLVNLEAHPDWVKSAIARLHTKALGEGIATALLPPPNLTTTIAPEEDDVEEIDEDEPTEGDWSPMEDPAPAQAPRAAIAQQPGQPQPKPPVPATADSSQVGPYHMTLDTAMTVTNKDGVPYHKLETSMLVTMINNMLKTPERDRTDEIRLKLDAARTIIYFRTHSR